jgi:threonine dehydratase
MKVEFKDIEKAFETLKGHIRKTPFEYSAAASQIIGTEIYLKCEHHQLTGSFKMRGAYNKISNLTEKEKKQGVIAASAGNHAQGVALSATKLGVESTIVMSTRASIVKQQATENYGAKVILHGDIFDDAYVKARELEKEKNYIFVHPYEDPLVIAGQGTVGLEMFQDIKDLDSVVVSIGGGGLISGIAMALKTLNPKIKVYGVVAENAPGMECLYTKKPVPHDLTYISIADGIAVKKPSPVMFENFISKYVDDIISIPEDEIAKAIVFLLERSKMVVEGSGAIALAAAFRKKWNLGKKCGLVMCGGNIDLNLINEIVDRGLSQSGRIARLNIVVSDQPGRLNKLTEVVAQKGANVLDVIHDRFDPTLRIRETKITFILETKNAQHIDEIRKALALVPGAKVL